MKNAFWKILTLVCAVLLVISTYKSCNRKKELSEVYNDIQRKDSVIARFTDNLGREHIAAQARQLTIEQLKRSNEKDLLAIKGEVKHWRDLYNYVFFASTSAGGVVIRTIHDTTIITLPNGIDTVKTCLKTFNWADKWLSLEGAIYSDSIKLSYSIRNEYSVVNKFVRPKWHKQKSLELEIVSANPNTSINSISNLVVKPEQKKWFQTKGAAFGVGVIGGILAMQLIK